MSACQTAQNIKTSPLILPPTPQRQYIEPPANTKDYAYCILYYEQLVQEWELWAASVQILTTGQITQGEKTNGGSLER